MECSIPVHESNTCKGGRGSRNRGSRGRAQKHVSGESPERVSRRGRESHRRCDAAIEEEFVAEVDEALALMQMKGYGMK